jgi:serine phosphatase RsbU (regulator of sigma subunit)
VQSLNDEFGSLAEVGCFATALMLTYNAGSDHLITVNAGHPRPLWYSRSKDAWRLLTHEVPERAADLTFQDPTSPTGLMNLPLGVVPETGYRQFAVPLAKGDVVVLYTDSLIEAADPGGRQLDEAGLLGLAEALDPGDPARFGRELLAAVADYQAGRPLQDDVTLLTLHHNAEDPPMS